VIVVPSWRVQPHCLSNQGFWIILVDPVEFGTRKFFRRLGSNAMLWMMFVQDVLLKQGIRKTIGILLLEFLSVMSFQICFQLRCGSLSGTIKTVK
jgi:hypothetical protein